MALNLWIQSQQSRVGGPILARRSRSIRCFQADIRSVLINVLRAAVAPKVVAVWIVYAAWIISLILIANWFGIWLAMLTKDALVWSVTTGVALVMGLTEAAEPGYFRRELSKVLSVVVIFEYIVNFVTFSFWIELLLQPVLALVVVAPAVVREPEKQKTWRRIRVWFLTILMTVIGVHTVRVLYASWQTLDWGLFALRAVWPLLLGVWVLVLVFLLAIVASYEEAFLQLKLYRDKHKGLWKAKLGLVLVLGIRLRWIREAGKGGTKHVARAESVGAAYEAAKCYKNELVVSKRQEAVN